MPPLDDGAVEEGLRHLLGWEGRDNETVKTFVRADFAHRWCSLRGPRATRLVPVLLCGGREHAVVPLAVPVVSAQSAHRYRRQLPVGDLDAQRIGAIVQRGTDLEARAGRGRADQLDERVDRSASPEAPPSPAASLGLTRREAEVLALVAEGRTNRQIGEGRSSLPRPPASTS
jgi:hypothetical protein